MAEFKEPRVIELWEMAKRSNLSEDELDSLKVSFSYVIDWMSLDLDVTDKYCISV